MTSRSFSISPATLLALGGLELRVERAHLVEPRGAVEALAQLAHAPGEERSGEPHLLAASRLCEELADVLTGGARCRRRRLLLRRRDMGRRSASETITKLLVAFLREPTWKQKDLERYCGVGTRTIRQCLLDLQAAGVPLDRDEDRPHVFWSVPRGWFPGRGGSLDTLDHALVARLVARLPRSVDRERILEKLIAPAFGAPSLASDASADVADDVLAVLESAAQRKVPVRMGYYSASRAEHGIRVVSVQRVAYGERTRFVAHCHASSGLKWFRADRVTGPCLDETAAFMAVDRSAIDRFLSDSLDGYRGGGDAVACELLVRAPESHWVLRNLPTGGTDPVVEHHADGVRVTMRTSALEVLACHVVGLGGAARVLAPPALRSRVLALARGAQLANGARLNVGTVRSIRQAK